MNKKVWPVLIVFFAMGFGDVVGPLVNLAKQTFNLSNTMANLLPSVGFIMFALLSIPFGLLQDKKGKKLVINIGLATAALGLLIPLSIGMYGPKFTPSGAHVFPLLLATIMLLCAGATVLQVAGNAIMKDVSADGKFSANLSLANGIKAIGSSLGFLVPIFAVKFFGLDWPLLFPIYGVLILVTLAWFNTAGIQEKPVEGNTASLSSCFKLLLENKYVAMMVLTIFLYVGAEVCAFSQTSVVLTEKFGFSVHSAGAYNWLFLFLPILIGRFLGPVFLKKFTPQQFFVIISVMAIAGVLLVFTQAKYPFFLGLILIGLGYANIFPMAYSITVDRMPERNNELSGLMVTAICGGAILPLLMGRVSDIAGLFVGYVVPLACLAYIVVVAFYNLKLKPAAK